MVLDYSERRQVNRNRPRRQFPWGILLANVLILVIGYAAGVGTGWFLFHEEQRVVAAPAPQAPVTPPAPQAPPASQAAPVAPPVDPQLTFYETLPKGSKQAILGTGINNLKPDQPQKQESATPPSPTPSAKPAERALPQGATPDVSEVATAGGAAGGPAKPESAKGTFSVQIASCKTREEAEALKAKHQSLNAYIVVSVVTGKGTWYRLRTGRKLSREAANQLAVKVGGQAIVVAE